MHPFVPPCLPACRLLRLYYYYANTHFKKSLSQGATVLHYGFHSLDGLCYRLAMYKAILRLVIESSRCISVHVHKLYINYVSESCFKSTLWCPVGVGIGIFVPLCLLLASIIICFISVSCLAKKRSNNVYQEHEFGVNMIPCPAYEVTSLRKEKIVMEKNPIYAIRSE